MASSVNGVGSSSALFPFRRQEPQQRGWRQWSVAACAAVGSGAMATLPVMFGGVAGDEWGAVAKTATGVASGVFASIAIYQALPEGTFQKVHNALTEYKFELAQLITQIYMNVDLNNPKILFAFNTAFNVLAGHTTSDFFALYESKKEREEDTDLFEPHEETIQLYDIHPGVRCVLLAGGVVLVIWNPQSHWYLQAMRDFGELLIGNTLGHVLGYGVQKGLAYCYLETSTKVESMASLLGGLSVGAMAVLASMRISTTIGIVGGIVGFAERYARTRVERLPISHYTKIEEGFLSAVRRRMVGTPSQVFGTIFKGGCYTGLWVLGVYQTTISEGIPAKAAIISFLALTALSYIGTTYASIEVERGRRNKFLMTLHFYLIEFPDLFPMVFFLFNAAEEFNNRTLSQNSTKELVTALIALVSLGFAAGNNRARYTAQSAEQYLVSSPLISAMMGKTLAQGFSGLLWKKPV